MRSGPAVILCPDSFAVRNVAHSGLVAELDHAEVPTVILMPDRLPWPTDAALPAGSRRDTLLEAPATGAERGLAAQRALLRASFARRHRLSSHRIFEQWRAGIHPPEPRWRTATLQLLAVPGAVEPCFGWQRTLLGYRARRALDLSAVQEQLRELRPAVVVSMACVAFGEYPYLVAAPTLGIPMLGCIRSFDNLTSRGPQPAFDSYTVWNERMRDEVLKFYPDTPRASVHVTGTPQFDFHRSPAFRWSRPSTLERLGLPGGARYIVVGANHAEFTPSEPDLVGAMAARFAATPALAQHWIVVRPHPYDDPTRWNGVVSGSDRIVLSLPSDPERPLATDQARLVSTLLHADVCLNTASTIALDAAALNTPVVCVGFGWKDGSEDHRCRELHFSEHYRPIIASGGVRLANNLTELVGLVDGYAADRSRDADARTALVRDLCGTIDGGAARRVAGVIASVVGAGGVAAPAEVRHDLATSGSK